MRKFTFLVFTVMALLGFTQKMAAQTFPFELSTEENPKWYFIESAGSGNAAYATGQVITIGAAGETCKFGPKTYADNQLFRFEVFPDDDTKFLIICKALPEGELNVASSAWGGEVSYSGERLFNNWGVELKTGDAGNKYRIVCGETVLHCQKNGSKLVSWPAEEYTSASVWKFVAIGDPNIFQSDITNAQALFDSTVGGAAFGQYPLAARTAFSNAIAAAQNVVTNIGSYTLAQVVEAQNALGNAVAQYKASIVGPESTAENPVWYVLMTQSTSAARLRKVISYDPADETKKIKAMSSVLSVPTDMIAWRIEKDPVSGKCALISKTDGSSVSATLGGENKAVCVEGTVFDWNLTPVTEKNLIYKFVNGITLHMGNDGYFINYDDEASQFKPIPVSAFYKEVLKFTIDSIGALKVDVTVGNKIGQYPAEAMATMTEAYNTAMGVYNGSATDEQALAARLVLINAWKAFKNTQFALYSTAENPTWVVFQVQVASTDTKRAGKILAYSAASVAGKQLIGIDTLGIQKSDSLMWRIEKDAETGMCALINKATNAYVSDFCAFSVDPAYIWQLDERATLVYNFNKNGAGGTQLMNLNNYSPFTTTNWSDEGASRFKAIVADDFFKLNTGISKVTASSLVKVFVENNKIVVLGTDAPVKVYTISGIEVDAAKTLTQGIYIVKVDGTTTKVVIK